MYLTMAQYNTEGDLSGINERQLEFIHQVILKQNLKINKVIFEPVGQAGDNFVANVKRIIIESDDENLRLIAKIAPSNEALRQAMNSTLLFTNEHVMYTEVLPKLVQLQKDKGVPEEEHLRFAKCYGSINGAPNEVVILEDLKASGFVMLDKFVSLSDDCVKSILKNFAILHSLSYVLKNKEPEMYIQFKGKLFDLWSQGTMPEFTAYFEQLETDIQKILDEDSHKNIIKNKVGHILKLGSELAKHDDNSKYSVIQQGDAWTNNVMFRFEGNKLQSSVMIDYQGSKNTSPVADILYMIFNCTDHEKRTRHFYDWIDYYHTELDKSLSYFDMKADNVYPRDELNADLKRYGNMMFGLSLLLASVLMRDTKESSKTLEAMKSSDISDVMTSMNLDNLADQTLERIQKKIVGLIESFIEFDLLT